MVWVLLAAGKRPTACCCAEDAAAAVADGYVFGPPPSGITGRR